MKHCQLISKHPSSFDNPVVYKNKPKILVYFHNLSYDDKFILKSTYPIQSLLQADGKQIQFSIHTPECEIVFRDTLRIYGADSALSKLPKMFLSKEEQSKIYKEIMPYDRYTKERYLGIVDDIAEAFKCLKGINGGVHK